MSMALSPRPSSVSDKPEPPQPHKDALPPTENDKLFTFRLGTSEGQVQLHRRDRVDSSSPCSSPKTPCEQAMSPLDEAKERWKDAFLQLDRIQLGYLPPMKNLQKLPEDIPRILGKGASGSVDGPYMMDEIICVQKTFYGSTANQEYENEKKTLEAFARCKTIELRSDDVFGLPSLISSDDINCRLAIAPYGIVLSEHEEMYDKTMFIHMLNCVRKAHAIGYLHRDIRPSNFIVSFDRFYLFDWAFSISIKPQLIKFAGTIHYASENVLSQIQQNPRAVKYTVADDLESLVKVFFIITRGSGHHSILHRTPLPTGASKSWDNDIRFAARKVQAFWTRCFPRDSLWNPLIKAARSGDAGALEKEIQRMPSF